MLTPRTYTRVESAEADFASPTGFNPTHKPMLFQCVPNFSEGRRLEIVDAIANAIRATPGATLIDHSADPDHNRCVMTFLGSDVAIRAAALAAARVAVAAIDLRQHSGVHPRTGAVDVLPVIPLGEGLHVVPEVGRAGSEEALAQIAVATTPMRKQAVALAREIGQDLATELALPVYFYEWAAEPGHRTALPDVRRGDFEAMAAGPLVGERAPDLGPPVAHPTAGVVVVGARRPLVAYNINLDTPDVEIARAIARQIRQERDRLSYLVGVRALGLYLASQERAQVSMNLTHPDVTPLPAVFAFVRDAAARLGAAVWESEIIGLIPGDALGGQPPEAILWRNYKPTQILDNWLT